MLVLISWEYPKGVSIALEIQNNNYALNEQIEEQILQVLVEKVVKIIKAIPNYDWKG